MQSVASMINRRHDDGGALGEALRTSVSKRSQLNATINNGDIVVDDEEELGSRALLHKVLPQRERERQQLQHSSTNRLREASSTRYNTRATNACL